ncbi:MAG TPA: helix-turn-helix transcriptional regulator [Vicinamibacterales bacterium]|nr:helix-turn-helix transcriptional regulator [Vicinamibacterales bacterium]
MSRIDPRDLLPLPPQDFQVLLSLTDGPRHAYGLATAIEVQAATGIRLGIGSLYRMLARLTALGLIQDFDPPADAAGHEARRKYYRITRLGRQVAAAEASRLEQVVRLARKQRLLPAKGER